MTFPNYKFFKLPASRPRPLNPVVSQSRWVGERQVECRVESVCKGNGSNKMELMMGAHFCVEEDCLSTSTLPSSLEQCIFEESDPIVMDSSQPLTGQLHLPANLNDDYYLSYFQPRTDQQVRTKYLEKLMRNGMLSDSPRQKCYHVAIFDWDDTLLCTSYLNSSKITEIQQMSILDRQRLEEIDKHSQLALRTALQQAEVYIVTNSISGWVHYSAKKFMPNTYQIIETHKIQVISARSQYSQTYPGDCQQWKIEAFRALLSSHNPRNTVLNMLVVGDSRHEMEAAESACRLFDRRFSKTIKLRPHPRLDELNKQLQLVCSKLAQVMRIPKNLTIRLQSKRTNQ